MTIKKQTVQGLCFMNELWLMRHPHGPQRIGKYVRASSYLFTRRAADVISKASSLR